MPVPIRNPEKDVLVTGCLCAAFIKIILLYTLGFFEKIFNL